MIFNSLLFIVFFVLVLAIHYSPIPTHYRRISLLLANYFFFASYYPPYLLLLILSTVIDWWLANRIAASDNDARRRYWLWGSVLLNIGSLCFFKYIDFLIVNVLSVLHLAHINANIPLLHLILPVGISFYTFQALSYTIDIYRRRIEPEPSLLNFALFVSFFPHLVAGPILRARDILPQCRVFHKATMQEFAWGLALLIWGLFQKTVLADQIAAPVANLLFDPTLPGKLTLFESWTAALAFTSQIFFDFSGYSTCAIGVALCLGFYIPDNFRLPYAASSFSDFWRRWHISLSSWLKDYLYISLGGNRQGSLMTYRNLMITMVLGGLWHGASWHFVAWGVWHGFLLAVEKALSELLGIRFGFTGMNRIASVCRWLLTLYGVIISWVLFRAVSLQQAWRIVKAMHTLHHWNILTSHIDPLPCYTVISLTLVTILLHKWLANSSIEAVFNRIPLLLQASLITICLLATIIFSGKAQNFIYFQF